MLRQLVNDLLTKFFPRFALQRLAAQIAFGEHHYPPARRVGQLGFGFAHIAQPYLYQPLNVWNLQRIVHDGSMRITEALIGFPQIGVGIKLQDTEAFVTFLVTVGQRLNQAERRGMVTAQDAHQFAHCPVARWRARGYCPSASPQPA